MTCEPISTAYFLNLSEKSASLCFSSLSLPEKGFVKCIPPFDTSQGFSNHVPAANYAINSEANVGLPCLYQYPFILSMQELVKTFPRQRTILKASFSMRSV
jgi:hypothetical protein